MKRRLEDFAADYRPQVEQMEAELDRLRAQRDDQIVAAYRDGLPMVEIAESWAFRARRFPMWCVVSTFSWR